MDALLRLKTAIQAQSVRCAKDNLIIAPNGRSQDWLIDLRPIFLDPEYLTLICDLFWDDYANQLPFQLAGMEVAAIPLLTGLLLSAKARALKDLNGLIIRKERKITGLGQSIEGKLNGKPIILVDDILNSANSAEKARVVLVQAGSTISQVFTVIDYSSNAALNWQKEHKISVKSLFKLSDFNIKPSLEKQKPTQHYKPLWRFVAHGANPYYVVPKSTPLLVDNQIFMGSDNGKMWSIDRHTGNAIWEFQAKGTFPKKGIWSSPCYYEDKLYFGAYNGNIYCLDATKGNEIWTNPCCDWVGSSPVISIKHGLIFIGLEYEKPRNQGSVAAFSVKTGNKVWEVWLNQYQHGSANYDEGSNLAIFGTNDHTVIALNAENGAIIWEFKTGRSVKYKPVINVQRSIVAFASFDGSIYVLDLTTGKKMGEFPTDNICYTTPLIMGNKLFCGSGDKHLYVIDLDTMTQFAKLNIGSRVYSSPIKYENRVIFGANNGVLHEINSETLEVIGRLQLPDSITNAPQMSMDGKHLYISTYMNELYAFERR